MLRCAQCVVTETSSCSGFRGGIVAVAVAAVLGVEAGREETEAPGEVGNEVGALEGEKNGSGVGLAERGLRSGSPEYCRLKTATWVAKNWSGSEGREVQAGWSTSSECRASEGGGKGIPSATEAQYAASDPTPSIETW